MNSQIPKPVVPIEVSLYEARQKIYPRAVHGVFAALRVTGVLVLLGLFYGVAWLQWDGRQAVLWDLPARKFYLFGFVFWPQDFIYLTALLVCAALSLFLFTAIAGRLWCGYACPQTVWTELFLWVERRIEGSRVQQQRLDAAPFSARKLAIKTAKHAIWLAIAAYTGFTFVGYFTPIRTLAQELATLTLGPWETFWVLFYGFATYGNAGWMREQVCKYMCPYARFQSAMFDRDTLTVAYDPRRGEPRGARRPETDRQGAGLGDCIDCGLCVQVCPTGIDIRKGLQYECIGCSACIDACNGVMDRMKYPRGLIRYTSERALESGRGRVLRPRIFVYSGILAAVVGLTAFGIATRVPLGLDVMRDRNQLYREVDAGVIENVYTIRILNMTDTEKTFDLRVHGIDGVLDHDLEQPLRAGAGTVLSFAVRLRADDSALTARSTAFEFELATRDAPELRVRREARFLGPTP